MNDKFIKKIVQYAERLVLKERDKYLSGVKNEFFSYDLAREYLFQAIDDAMSLVHERAELMHRIRELEEQLKERK